MTFDELLDNLKLFDFEVTAFDWLLVIQDYRTGEETIFHNATPNEVYEFIKKQRYGVFGLANNTIRVLK